MDLQVLFVLVGEVELASTVKDVLKGRQWHAL
jgi:hypothetical protein